MKNIKVTMRLSAYLKLFVVSLFLILPFGCNVVETKTEHKINIEISGDLSVDSGKYDVIRINILDTNKTVIIDGAFNGPWKDDGSHKIKGIDAGNNPPKQYIVEIIAYKNGVKKLQYNVAVKEGVTGNTIIVFQDTPIKEPPVDPNKPIPVIPPETTVVIPDPNVDTTKPKPPVKVEPSSVVIVEGDSIVMAENSKASLSAQVIPELAEQEIVWTTINALVVEVDSLGNLSSHGAGSTIIRATSKVKAQLFDTLRVKVVKVAKVNAIVLSTDSLLLYVGGETNTISASFLPLGEIGIPEYRSRDTSVATINSFGVVTAKKAGTTWIYGNPVGYSALIDSAKVVVVKDAPVIDAGSDRSIKVGDDVTFTVKVTQQYGEVVILKWDLDGDKKYEDSVIADHADLKHKYAVAGTFEVSFVARDKEGNTTTLTRRVVVGSAAPFVDIVKPGKDTSITTTKFTLEYLVDNVKKTKDLTLVEGANPIVIADTGTGGIGKDSVRIWVDSKAPVVKILSPTDSLYTNKASLTVTWSVDDVDQKINTTAALTGEGPIAITREATDSLGNKGVATVTVIRDVTLPIVKITSPIADSWTNKAKVSVIWSIDNIKQNTDTTETFSTGDGVKTITRTFTDAAGNKGTATVTVNLDQIAPTVEISSPKDGALVTSRTVTVVWAVDTKNQVDSVTETLRDLDGLQTITRRGTDLAGNTTTKSIQVNLDRKGYKVLITSPADNFLTNQSSLPVVWSIDGINQTTLTTETFSAGDGPKTITRSTTDAAGKTVSFTVNGTVDKTAPSKPTFLTSTTISPTRIRTPIWAWQSGGAGNGTFRYQLGTATAVVGPSLSFTGSNLPDASYTLTVAERDDAGNWSINETRAIQVKGSAPSAPDLKINAALSNAPKWTWSSTGGGNGNFRFQLGNAAYPTTGSTALSYAPTNLGEGLNTLCVEEQDVIGWGAESCAGITVDKSIPTLEITEPLDEPTLITSINPVIKGTVFDNNLDLVRYTVDNGTSKTVSVASNNWTIGESYTDGDHTVRIYARDKAGNPEAQQSITIHKRSKVIFVRKNTGGTGKSWADAYSELSQAMSDSRTSTAGTQIWVSSGTYSGNTSDGFVVKTENSLYGGFSSDGKMWDLTKRSFTGNKTVLKGNGSEIATVVTIGNSDESDALTRNNVTIDGFEISNGERGVQGFKQCKNINVINCTFVALSWFPIHYDGGTGSVQIRKCRTNQNGRAITIAATKGNVIIDSLVALGNYDMAIEVNSFDGTSTTKVTISNSKLLDPTTTMYLLVDPNEAEVRNSTLCGGVNTINDVYRSGYQSSGIVNKCTE